MKQLSRSIPIGVRFGLNVEQHESGCWVWKGGRCGKGYGKISYGGRSDMAHRVSWKLLRGPIPVGAWVLHKCDNPPCVNPDHLFLGTPADNRNDCIAKGRHADYTGRFCGEGSGSAKLTNEQVIEMRRLNAEEGIKGTVLAKRYGINTSHAYDILNRTCWSHI